VAEQADALRSGRSGLYAHVGSTPTFGISHGGGIPASFSFPVQTHLPSKNAPPIARQLDGRGEPVYH
jgi:hypothetical protein